MMTHRLRILPVLALATALAGCSDPERVRAQLEKASSAPQATATLDTAPQAAPQETADSGRGGGASAAPLTIPQVYVVQGGDTLFAISRRYGLPVRAVIDRNGLTPPYHLISGREIFLPQQRVHTVAAGDTLYGLSRRYKTDTASLAALNRLAAPYAIHINQRLLVPGPESAILPFGARANAAEANAIEEETLGEPAALEPPVVAVAVVAEPVVAAPQTPVSPASAGAPPPRSGAGFLWPLEAERGTVLSRFGPQGGGQHNDGINLGAPTGTPIIAAENGRVAYVGDDLEGLGLLLLLHHEGSWITAYAHAARFAVSAGDVVQRGQVIGSIGASGEVSTPQLHFELRKRTRAVDPLTLLKRAAAY